MTTSAIDVVRAFIAAINRRKPPELSDLMTEELRVLEEPGRVVTPEGKARMTVYVDVSDVDALYERLHPKLVALPDGAIEPPREKPWRQREFMVRLPDGDWMAFGQAVARTSG